MLLRWCCIVSLIAGVWLIAAPFVLGYSGTPLWNDIIIGIIISGFAIFGLGINPRLPT